MEECQKVRVRVDVRSRRLTSMCMQGTLNSRINILYLLDSLCETCLLAKPPTGASTRDTGQSSSSYVDFVSRDLTKLVEYVVPDGQHGMPNFMSTVQVRSSSLLHPTTGTC